MKTIASYASVRGVMFGLLSLAFLISPALVVAQNYNEPGLVKCEGALTADEIGKKDKCDFAQLIETIKYLINWMIYITVPIVIVIFAYAGFLFMTAKESNISKAKHIFSNVVIGFFFMLAAWVIVHSILKFLVRNDSYLFFFN